MVSLSSRYNVDEVKTNDTKILSKLLEKVQKRLAKQNQEPSQLKQVKDQIPVKETPRVDKSQTHLPVLGGQSFQKNTNVKPVLPNWLKNPTVISTDLSTLKKVKQIEGLDKSLTKLLKANGFTHLMPVQANVIPWLLKHKPQVNSSPKFGSPNDICVSAPTGSGKTLAYVLPIIQNLKSRFIPRIRALVVVPVQELAVQVEKVFKQYTVNTTLSVLAITGGRTSIETEKKLLVRNLHGEYESRIDILVTTPGRLVEHLDNTEGFNLRHLKYLVIDEADRVTERLQNNWLHHLEKHIQSDGIKSTILSLNSIKRIQSRPQKLLFSATLSQDPEKLKQLNLFSPKLFTSVGPGEEFKQDESDFVGKFTTPQELEEFYVIVDSFSKPLAILQFLEKGWKHILCFTKSTDETHKLALLLSFLKPKLKVKEISSVLPSTERDETLNKFASGEIDMLVCSDLFARGIDITSVEYVISYEPPKNIKGYIHRAGRTGRAGKKGTSIILLTEEQSNSFLKKLKSVNKNNLQNMTIDDDGLKKYKQKYEIALAKLKEHTMKETADQNKNLKTIKRKYLSKKRNSKKKKIE